MSEGAALRQVEEGRSRELHLQSALLNCEQQCMAREEERDKVKVEYTRRIHCLRTLIQVRQCQ